MVQTAIVNIAGGLMMGFCKHFHSLPMFMFGRFLCGVSSGMNELFASSCFKHYLKVTAGVNLGLAPLYLMEIAPISHRGMFGGFSQLTITVAMLCASIMGLEPILGDDETWQYLLGKMHSYINFGFHNKFMKLINITLQVLSWFQAYYKSFLAP